MVAGWAADRFGRKRTFLLGLAVFVRIMEPITSGSLFGEGLVGQNPPFGQHANPALDKSDGK